MVWKKFYTVVITWQIHGMKEGLHCCDKLLAWQIHGMKEVLHCCDKQLTWEIYGMKEVLHCCDKLLTWQIHGKKEVSHCCDTRLDHHPLTLVWISSDHDRVTQTIVWLCWLELFHSKNHKNNKILYSGCIEILFRMFKNIACQS